MNTEKKDPETESSMVATSSEGRMVIMSNETMGSALEELARQFPTARIRGSIEGYAVRLTGHAPDFDVKRQIAKAFVALTNSRNVINGIRVAS